MAERFWMHLCGTGQAEHTAIAAATQHCEHAAIIRTVVYSGVFLIYYRRNFKKWNKRLRPMTMEARCCPEKFGFQLYQPYLCTARYEHII